MLPDAVRLMTKSDLSKTEKFPILKHRGDMGHLAETAQPAGQSLFHSSVKQRPTWAKQP